MDTPETIFFSLLILAFPITISLIWFRRRAAARRFASREDSNTPIEGTDADRARSEREQAVWKRDRRSQLAQDMEIIGRVNTMDGYSQQYVEDLLTEIRKAGIACEFNFQETTPMGVGASIISPMGNFEIFVDKTRVEEAVAIVEKFRKG